MESQDQTRSNRFWLRFAVVVILLLLGTCAMMPKLADRHGVSSKIYFVYAEIKNINAAALRYYEDLGEYPPDTANFSTGDVPDTKVDPQSIVKYLGTKLVDKNGKEWGPYIQLQQDYIKDRVYIDPWGNPYRLDAMHSIVNAKTGTVIRLGSPYPKGTTEDKIKLDLKIWSCGPDGKDKNGSNVIEGLGDAPEDQDNITNWAD
jgi:hypothetical protein